MIPNNAINSRVGKGCPVLVRVVITLRGYQSKEELVK